MRFQTLSVCLAVTVIMGGCQIPAPYTYTGRVVDRRGRPATDATVIGWKSGPTPTSDEIVSVAGDIVESDGTFELPSPVKLDKIIATRGGKHEVTLNNPKPTGNVLVPP